MGLDEHQSRRRGKPRIGGRRWGSLICHAGLQALAVLALANTMISTPFGTQTLLITAVGFSMLQATGFSPTVGAAIPLAAKTVAADIKQPTAGREVTNELVKDRETGSRHGPGEGTVDNLCRSCQDDSRCVGAPLTGGCQ